MGFNMGLDEKPDSEDTFTTLCLNPEAVRLLSDRCLPQLK